MLKKRIFISFAIEDVDLRDLFLEQAKIEAPNYEFISIKEPWISDWKKRYRETISDFDGLIIIVTSHTKTADGQLWELKCTREMLIPICGIRSFHEDHQTIIPEELEYIKIVDWTWLNITRWLDTL